MCQERTSSEFRSVRRLGDWAAEFGDHTSFESPDEGRSSGTAGRDGCAIEHKEAKIWLSMEAFIP
jgi:hypothetical protein